MSDEICILIPVITAGLVIGYTARDALTPPSDRVTRILEIYTEFCIPNLTGSQPIKGASIGLSPVAWPEGNWIDMGAQAFIELSAHGCDISAFDLIPLNHEETKKLSYRLVPIVQETFPNSSYDPRFRVGTISFAWRWVDKGSSAHWITYFISAPDGGEHAFSKVGIEELVSWPKP